MASKSTVYGITKRTESLCLQTVDLKSLQAELEDVSFCSDDEESLEAIKYSQEQIHEIARQRAEELLTKNPANAAAIYVNGLEAESRQDWGEAGIHDLCFNPILFRPRYSLIRTNGTARFFLVGMAKNSVDVGFEVGFQTNVDMIRSVRNRWEGGQPADKWDDVLSFKPRSTAAAGLQAQRPLWWRLGPLYEALLQASRKRDAATIATTYCPLCRRTIRLRSCANGNF
jgi:hypothetical protein